MEKEKSIFFIVFVVLAASCAGCDDQHLKWRRWGPSCSNTPSSINKFGSSIIFPLYGNVYPNGFYFVQVYVGYPPRPYFLDPDTGSDLTWLQCDAPCVRCTTGFHPLYRPSNDLVVCRDPLCASLHSSDYKCDNPEQCDYEVEYADGGSSLGVLVNDLFTLNLTSGVRMSPRLTIGCGYDQLSGASDHPLDGVFGLGRGKSSIVTQLHNQGIVKNIIGHCISGQGGFLFLGEDVYDSSRITWTPMSRDHTKHYAAGSAELRFGGKSTGFKNLDVIFDSGSSYTYFSSQIYHALLTLIHKELSGKSLKEATDDHTLPFCWKGKKPFKSTRDVRKYFKSLAFSFSSGWRSKSQFEIPPEGYLIISSKGNACLGILNGTDVGLDNVNMVGDISMQDKLLVYDNEKQSIGWAAANCEQHPKSSTI
ncbi:Eukaryotic aspartyl protease family protein [Perilla frutescens var. hirtella]|uniref:Aspartic proteinase Asp1 n=1 Tax=Perilla frutescens var. hirtella TaxID=608512 RepID=A0AAD4JHF6_PERFH|nr:Eukaryotic aspartyl protease family protein [Perilla frutescens var. hirtella]KAH6810343.1 Eukaryotic aspartyl protease family protein [Perilla frutescens var. frutescens]KAH6833867.1 Eukaryotic aspartyl protease family protein [Perilla frutescens var. hirtella]